MYNPPVFLLLAALCLFFAIMAPYMMPGFKGVLLIMTLLGTTGSALGMISVYQFGTATKKTALKVLIWLGYLPFIATLYGTYFVWFWGTMLSGFAS
jgi:hypothetical protein